MRKSLLVAVFVLVGWISVPAHAGFCPGVSPWVFDDVLDTDPFCGYITEMAVRGVTLGCFVIDANHRLYCPTASVRRDQMAAFLSRLATGVFQQGGNAFGATAVLGTTDNNAIDVLVNGSRVMRYEPNFSPNIVGGHPNNSASPLFFGQTIGGGGDVGNNCYDPPTGQSTRSCGNRALGNFATVGGGNTNAANGSVGLG